jgi:hypothetical protein
MRSASGGSAHIALFFCCYFLSLSSDAVFFIDVFSVSCDDGSHPNN